MKPRLLSLAAAVFCIATGALASAETTATPAPSAAPAPFNIPIPAGALDNPYVKSILNALGGITQSTKGNAAYGKVTFFKRFDLQVQTAPTVYREIHLHQGTVINPRGTTLRPGMVVAIDGAPQGDGSLNADTITVK